MSRKKMETLVSIEKLLIKKEFKAISKLNSPFKIQAFLDDIPYSTKEVYRCPLSVIRDNKVHYCFDGAIFAAAMLCRLGHAPLVLEMLPNDRDHEHLVALYQREGHWGAVAKSGFIGLRFREPIYRSLRELVMSYFEDYYNFAGEKTLRGYTIPLNLKAFDRLNWMTNNSTMDLVAERLGEIRNVALLTPSMITNLSPMDKRSYAAGMLGVSKAELYKPQ